MISVDVWDVMTTVLLGGARRMSSSVLLGRPARILELPSKQPASVTDRTMAPQWRRDRRSGAESAAEERVHHAVDPVLQRRGIGRQRVQVIQVAQSEQQEEERLHRRRRRVAAGSLIERERRELAV